MRRANTTFVNLRATLDDLDPLVEESKPVAKKLRPFLAEAAAAGARRPADARDLATLIKQPGREQRPDRAHALPNRRCATSRPARSTATARRARGRSPLHEAAARGDARARVRKSLRPRSHRPVRRLQPHRHVRRPRRRPPAPPRRERVHVRRTAPSSRCRPNCATRLRSAASINQRNRCPGRLFERNRAVQAGGRLQVRSDPGAARPMRRDRSAPLLLSPAAAFAVSPAAPPTAPKSPATGSSWTTRSA